MAALISIDDAKVWLSQTKAPITTIEDELADQLSTTVVGAVSARYSTDTWVDEDTTPLLIRRIISMFYAGYYYHRTFSNDSEPGAYGDRLLADAQTLLNGIVDGTIDIPSDVSIPVVTSMATLTIAPELVDTDPVFSMSQVF